MGQVDFAMKTKLDTYLRPEFLVPVASLPEDGEDLSAKTQATLENLYEVGLDNNRSIGKFA